MLRSALAGRRLGVRRATAETSAALAIAAATSARGTATATAPRLQQPQSQQQQPQQQQPLPTAPAGQCLLCDEDYTDWMAHLFEPRHVARHAVCGFLVSPEKHAAIMQQMWDHVQLDFRLVDDINARKIARRRGRLTSTLAYLRDTNAIQHAFLQWSPMERAEGSSVAGGGGGGGGGWGWAASQRFAGFVVVGRRFLRCDVTDRVARLLPKASAWEVRVICDFVLGPQQLEQLHDMLALSSVASAVAPAATATTAAVPPNAPPLRAAEKAAVATALIGELHASTTRERARDVTDRATADALVSNVLAQHALDNAVSELVHAVLQSVVEEGTPVWRQYKEQLAANVLPGGRARPSLLSVAPAPTPRPKAAGEATVGACAWLTRLQPQPVAVDEPTVPLRPKPVWQDLQRSSVLDVSVAKPATKTAFFAPCMPKLALKPRNVVPPTPPLPSTGGSKTS